MTEQLKTLEEVLKGAPKGTVAYFDGTGGWSIPKKFKKNSTGGWDEKRGFILNQGSWRLADDEDNSCTVIDPDRKRLWPLTIHVHVTEPEPKEYESAELAESDTIFISSTHYNRLKATCGNWSSKSGSGCSSEAIQDCLDHNTGILILPEEYDVVKQALEAHRNQNNS